MNKIAPIRVLIASAFMLLITTTQTQHTVFHFDASTFGCTEADMHEIEFFTTAHNTHITVLQHKNGAKFIVKQEARSSLTWHLATVRDALGSLIAESIRAPANRVIIIPAYHNFIGKKNLHLPATLHTFVPGVMVKTLANKRHLYIQQPLKPGRTKGFSRQIISNMATHQDLPIITALDTFTANKDRHKGNFFYDSISDRFFAIDLESAFGDNLAQYACNLIKSLLQERTNTLSELEIKGLRIYRNTLSKLTQLHTPESLYQTLATLAYQCGISSSIMRTSVHDKLQHYRKAITENYASCQELIELLDTLLTKHRA